jgi:hypothetical protein
MKFNLNIKELLEYFDLRESSEKGDATSIVSIAGEDLNSAIFKYFCEKQSHSRVKVFDDNTPTIGKNAGKRLDRWIFEESGKNKKLYQVEIKNWSARAIGGIDIALDINPKELLKLIKRNWDRHFLDINSKSKNSINKVFSKMIPKDEIRNEIGNNYKQVPLLIIWEAAHPQGKNEYWYRYKVNKKYFHFDYCDIFSCSLYLRYLRAENVEKIGVEMANVARRLSAINRLFILRNK